MDLESLGKESARTAAALRMQLAQMTAASQLLERTASDATSREHLAVLNQGICRMLRIVGRMELAYRLGDGVPQMELAAIDLGQMVKELGEQMARLLSGINVTLTVQAPPHLLGRVDRGLLRHMLLELVSNGARAGDRVRLTLLQKEDQAMFSVEDNGPDVSMERLKDTLSGEGGDMPEWRRGGSGIAIAQQIAVLHGGRLMADGASGRGLNMVVIIPLGKAELGRLESPRLRWDRGGFDEALVGLSHLLPAQAFAPEGRC